MKQEELKLLNLKVIISKAEKYDCNNSRRKKTRRDGNGLTATKREKNEQDERVQALKKQGETQKPYSRAIKRLIKHCNKKL